MCVMVINFAPVSPVFLFDFGSVSRAWWVFFFILLLKIKPTRMAALILSKSVRVLHIINNGSIENQNKITESKQNTVQKPNNLSRTFKHWIFFINIIYEEIYIKTGFFIGRSVHFFHFILNCLKAILFYFEYFKIKIFCTITFQA